MSTINVAQHQESSYQHYTKNPNFVGYTTSPKEYPLQENYQKNFVKSKAEQAQIYAFSQANLEKRRLRYGTIEAKKVINDNPIQIIKI